MRFTSQVRYPFFVCFNYAGSYLVVLGLPLIRLQQPYHPSLYTSLRVLPPLMKTSLWTEGSTGLDQTSRDGKTLALSY
jgi:hypothetical protein